jgi:hypothetical protein
MGILRAPEMLQGNVVRQPVHGLSVGRGALVWFAAIAGFVALGLRLLPIVVFSDESIGIIIVGISFVVLLGLNLGAAITKCAATRLLVYRMALLTWWFLLVCEVIFERQNDVHSVSQGQFSAQAYGEALMWGLSFLVLMIISLQQAGYLREAFSGSYKWISLFTTVCVLSIAYTPGKAYAAAWGFKLVLVVLLLQLCASVMKELNDVMAFLKITLWAFLWLSIVPVVVAFWNPSTAFEDGRLNADPDLLSPTAAALMLMSMVLYSIEKKKYYIPTGLIGVVVMFLAFGKAGIIAGTLSALLFLMLQRKVVRSIGLLLGLGAIGGLIVSVTPLADYLQSYQGGSTLTGRTAVWSGAIAGIKQSPIIGHGYLATFFSFEQSSDLMEGYTHLHNGFLETAYNTGLIGLTLILVVHFVMVRNIFKSLRMATTLRSREPRSEQATQAYLLSCGLLVMYVNAFFHGLFAASFGGRAMSPYMFFLAVFVLAEALRRLISERLSRSLAGSAA